MYFSTRWPSILLHQNVRDLAWMIFSPSLLDHNSGLETMHESFLGISKNDVSAFITHLKKLNSSPEDLTNFLQIKQNIKQNKRLGNYFEQLIQYWLSCTSSCHKLETHVVIQRQQETLGEFDFLFFSEQLKKTIHWEAAVKFYLLHGNKDDFASYIGPNPVDTLENKILTLKKQLTLSQRIGRRFLESEHLLPIESACLVKGYIFYPLLADGTLVPTPTSGIAAKHLYGWWDRVDNEAWKKRCRDQNSGTRLLPLSRLAWLAPHLYSENDPYFNQNSFTIEAVPQLQTPCMLASFVLIDEVWQEVERGMLVSSNWPQTK